MLLTANTRHTANSNLCREQHTAKTGHTTKANLTLTPTASRQRLPCVAVRHTAKPWFAVCLMLAHANRNFAVCQGCSTRQTVCLFFFFQILLSKFFLVYTLTICNSIIKFHKVWNMFAIFLQLTTFNFIFPDAVKFELRLSKIVGIKYRKKDIHVTQPCLRTHIRNGNDFRMPWLGDTTLNMRRYFLKILINVILFYKF